MTPDDPFDLQRFVDAQAGGGPGDPYEVAVAELRAGRKRGHWVWYVLPQLRGLGRSGTAKQYGLGGVDEARAYLAHPVLGERLHECTDALLALGTTNPAEVVGPDDVKLRSSMTLFAAAAPEDPAFPAVLDRFFGGRPDPRTSALLTP